VILVRWLGLALTLLSSALLAAASWPTPRYVDANIDCPKQLRLGDVDTMTLSVSPEFSGEGDRVVVAYVQAAGLRVTPPGDMLQPARPGQPARWRWQVAADGPGPRQVAFIISLRQGQDEQPIWARSLTITVTDVLGMPAATARSVALAGALSGFGLSLVPFLWALLRRRQA
jgi:hypothetical protein